MNTMISSDVLDELYIKAVTHPGTIKTVPPFNDVTSVTNVIPLILNTSLYTSIALTPAINGGITPTVVASPF